MVGGTRKKTVCFAFLIVCVFCLAQNSLAQSSVCGSPCPEGVCVYRIQSNIFLNCSFSTLFLFKLTDLTESLIANKTQTEFCVPRSGKRSFLFKNLSTANQGRYIAKEDNDDDEGTLKCNVTVLVHDINETRSYLTVENNTFQVNQSSEWQIDSFDSSFTFNFKIEALPLDSLILNGTKLNNSSKCNSANPWLNCLQSGSTFPLEKCKDSYEIMFSYNYNDAELYTGSITGDSIGLPQVFNHTFKLIYPPKVEKKTVDITYDTTDSTKTLVCDVQCDAGKSLTYNWYASNGSLLTVSSNQKSIEYKITEPQTVYCEVTNTIDYKDITLKNESRTYFLIQLKTTKTSTGLQDWEIAVIIVNAVLAFVIIGGLLFYIFVFRKRSMEKPNKSEIVDNNVSGNIYDNNNNKSNNNSVGNLSQRQRKLSEEMVENPVFGKDLRLSDIDVEDQSIASNRSESIKNVNKKNQTNV